ncbi:MAG: MFS transporter [Solirubrobacterales bacterium]|nr:MFS transporter [Solirubrobacterales bacterium]
MPALDASERYAVDAAIRATYAAFVSMGFAFASWASRIPQVRRQLSLDPSKLGLVLLAMAAGSLIALPLAGPAVTLWGSRVIVSGMATLAGVGLVAIAFGCRIGVAPVVGGLLALGFGTGGWDVAMNVQGAVVEQHRGRAIMPRFHAGFSVGTVAGALGGAAMVALEVSVTVHLVIVAVAVATGVPVAVRRFIADHVSDGRPGTSSDSGAVRKSLRAWRESRTLLIGVFVLALAFAEGSGNDWLSLAMIDDHHARPAVGTLALASFLAAMTVGRWFGPRLLDEHGRVPVLRASLLMAIAGLGLFAFGPSIAVAFAGTILWGAGISLGFPVGMSAGADEPALAAARVSVIASIGYCAFLGGPPLIGFLAQRYTVLHALSAVIALLLLAGAVANATRPPPAAD